MATAEEVPLATCYTSGSIAGAIIGTALITISLGAAAALIYNLYWRSRKGKHLVLVTDIENPNDEYAFDNPGFREATPIKKNLTDEKLSKLERGWLGGISPRTQNLRTVDDSFLSDSQVKVVSLKSRDFTGLGFSVCGNMRDGIFVKDLMHRGPAFESGCINPGDRILRMSISFRHMVYEDALTILSYASPYDVQLDVEHNPVSKPATLIRSRRDADSSSGERIRHPFYRSQSSMDLPLIGKSDGKVNSHTIANRQNDNSLSFSDYPTLKLTPSASAEKSERKGGDVVEGSDTLNRLQKLGIRVLPTSLSPKHKSRDVPENDDRDVKTLLTKGLQNLKGKINHNSLGRKKKDDESDLGVSEFPACEDIPEEVARAGEVARSSRQVHLVTSSTPTEIAIPNLQTIVVSSNSTHTSNDSFSDGSLPKVKKSKGKAPAPPQSTKDEAVRAENIAVDDIQIDDGNFQEIEPRTVLESESEIEDEVEERTCTRATVHHSPAPDDVEPGRKAASLGDLSRLDVDNVASAPLERAVSLDLDASQSGKKRKAPPVPVDDFSNAFDDVVYCKEPRIEGYNTFLRRLKKSSEYGTLEDALQEEESVVNKNQLHSSESSAEIQVQLVESSGDIEDHKRSPGSFPDMEHVAAANIQEFSTWLAEVRKDSEIKPLNTTVCVNGSSSNDHALSNDVTLTVNSIPSSEDDSTQQQFPDPKSSFTLMVNGQNVVDHNRTVLVISQPNSLESEETLDNIVETEEETPPQLPTSPIPSTPSSSLTYITEINVSEPKEPKPARKDAESSKIPIRTLRSETGQRVLATIQQLQKSPPPAVPPRRTDSNEIKDRSALNGSTIQSTVSFPVKTSATKIVFESHGSDMEEF